ncbi:D-alanyl-D-alanine endopeptidase [Tepidimonas charontis]|uniref:D-alanyl-D-alanine endopeptidase n=2 Tax=Tepidimonas charontis TaxID=2267262 RepID=A0A554XKS9_9BURK|nr:D-alanyl-D-alanine endopeptidase [Tepidimonas charontis]
MTLQVKQRAHKRKVTEARAQRRLAAERQVSRRQQKARPVAVQKGARMAAPSARQTDRSRVPAVAQPVKVQARPGSGVAASDRFAAAMRAPAVPAAEPAAGTGAAALAWPGDEATGVQGQRLDTLWPEPLALHSNAALVVDRDTNAVLLGKNEAAVLPIASLTKLMTGLVIADAGLPLEEVLTITDADVDRLKGSGSRLAVGTRLTRGEALHLALMASENRAAHALGRTYPGGLPAFVAAMNRKAAELGMTQTRFVEPTGLSSDNRSSPRDLARLAAAAAERPLLRQLSTSPEYELQAGKRVVHFRNSNRLVRESEWNILLQKTGYIREAGRCVVMQVRLAGRDLIMVLMDAANSTARWADAERLLRWLDRTLVTGEAATQPRVAL